MIEKTKYTMSIELLSRVEQLAKQKYEEEIKREESLIAQSSNMQTVFSVSTAALFMLLPIIIDKEYRGNLSLNTTYLFVSIITFCLLSSLFFATRAQARRKRVMFATMDSIINEIGDTSKFQANLENPFTLTRKLINSYHEAYKSLFNNNNKRVILIRISMWLFYISLGLCIVFYLVSTYILFV